MRNFYSLILSLFLVYAQAQTPPSPNLNQYKTTKEKLQAWATYCDTFLFVEDYKGLRKVAHKGLRMTPPKELAFQSLYHFYIGITFNYGTETDSALYYLERSEKFARAAKNNRRIEAVLSQLLVAYNTYGNGAKRDKVLAEIEARADTIKDNLRKGKINGEIANYYTDKDEYEKGLKYRLKAIKARRAYLFKGDHDDSINFGVTLVNVAELYIKLRNPEKTLEYLRESQLYMKDYRDGIATIYTDFTTVLLQQNKPEAAKVYYKKLLDFLNKGAETTSWTIFIDSDLAFAEYYLEHKNERLALAYTSHALQYSKYADNFQRARINHLNGKIYLRFKQYEKALGFFKKAEPIMNEDSPEAQSSLQKSLAETYAALGDWKRAYHHFNVYSNLQDNLLNEKAKSNLAKMEAQYQNKKKEGEIKTLSAQNTIKNLQIKNAARQKWYFIFGLLLLGIIGSLLFYQSRNRKRTNEKLQLLNDELDAANKVKARFFSILNHDLRSPVSSLIHFLHLQKDSPELLDAESKKRMETKTISTAENLLDSMEDMLLWSKGQMENFEPHFQNVTVHSLFHDLEKHFSNVETVQISFENSENLTLFSDENYLKTILRNLTGNAINALEKTPNAQVIVNAFTQNGLTFISVADNGPGGTIEKFRALYDEKEVVGIKTGLGLHLIRDLAKAINCQITVDTQPDFGTTFTILFVQQ